MHPVLSFNKNSMLPPIKALSGLSGNAAAFVLLMLLLLLLLLLLE